jgi:hypothetical protein
MARPSRQKMASCSHNHPSCSLLSTGGDDDDKKARQASWLRETKSQR